MIQMRFSKIEFRFLKYSCDFLLSNENSQIQLEFSKINFIFLKKLEKVSRQTDQLIHLFIIIYSGDCIRFLDLNIQKVCAVRLQTMHL